MGSLQVEKRNAERQNLVTHRKHIDDWKKVSVGRLLEILDFNTKAPRTHILEK